MSDTQTSGFRPASRLAGIETSEILQITFRTAAKLERAQAFAAEMAWQSLTTLAAAEGAVSAYSHITGSEWKPYAGSSAPSATVSAQAVKARASAFE